MVLGRRGDFAGADSAYTEALAIRRRLHPPGHPEVGATLNNLGALRLRAGEDVAAEPLLRESLSIRRAALGAHMDVAATLNNLATSLERAGAAG